MKRSMKRYLPLLLVVPALAAGEQPTEFAYGLPLSIDGGAALYQLETPAAVYSGAVRADLGDVRVFNGAGEVVPHAFRPRVTTTRERPQPVKVALFPVRTDAPAGIEALDLRIERSGGRAVIDLRTRDGKPAAGARLVGYLADASALDAPLRAVVLELPPGTDNVVSRATLEASDDLREWSTLATGASIVKLASGGERLEQLRIEFAPRKAKYLRLSWPGRMAALALGGLAVEPGDAIVDSPRQWTEAPAAAVKDKPGEFELDLGGQFPTDRLRVNLPQPNTVASIEILARPKPADPWRHVARATVYRLNREGEEVKSPDIAIDGAADRYWLLRVDQRGGGLGSGTPALVAGWIPHRLVFAARGEPPFQLAYGSRDAKPAAFAIATLVSGYKEDAPPDIRPARVDAAAPQPLGGAAVMRERIDWRRWMLWGSLILGVAVLGWMAMRLGKQMAQPAAVPPHDPA